MATLQKLPQSSTNTTLLPQSNTDTALLPQSSTDTALLPQSEVGVTEQFPAGLKVLVVDDDSICLKILEKMLRRCLYDVTTCSQATFALKLLRERKGFFDMVLSDVHMPDMDGFKLLEHVGFEMDLPVIMMSADGRTSAVMKGIRHGACDYLIKPIREEELKNIWQHVVRKKWNENKENEHSGGFIDNDRPKQGSDHTEYASSAIEGAEGIKLQKKKRYGKEDDVELENDDPTTSKKPRVVWSVELHQQFVSAVNQLGIDKAVPKRILELMNVPGLTRENVASHLQKFRLYLKRLSGVAQQQGGIPNTFYGHMEQNPKPASLGRIDMQALASSGQISPQTLAALHSELLGWSSGNLAFPTMDQSALLQASLQASKCLPVDHGAAYGQLLTKCPSNTSKTFSHSNLPGESAHSLVGALPSSIHGAIGFTSNFVGLDSQNGNILMGILQQQPCQQVDPQQQKQAVLLEPSSSINVQPSCLVVPSQPRSNFQSGHKSASVSQICNFNSGSILDYSLPASQSNNSSFYVGRMMDGDFKSSTLLNNYADPYTISPSVSSCSMNAENGIQTFTSTRHTGIIPNICDMQGSHSSKSEQVIDQRMLRNIGFVGKGTTIPSRFAVDEPLSPVRNLNCGKTHADNNDSKLKQEPNVDSMENIRVGAPGLQPSCQNDLTRVFSE